MKKVLALTFALIALPSMASDPPDDIKSRTETILLHCAPSLERMTKLLAETWGETPVAFMELSRSTRAVIFTNKNSTTTSIVIDMRSKTGGDACLLWSGKSEDGLGWMVNPNPVFPVTDGYGA